MITFARPRPRAGVLRGCGLGLMLVALMVFGAACGAGPAPAQPDPADGSRPADGAGPADGATGSTAGDGAPAPDVDFPYTFTDDAGRTVTIERRPERIITLAPSHTEVLFTIGAGDRVVGVDSFSDYPAEAAELPRLGGLTDTNYEQIVALAPDLALAIGGTDEQVARLEELGIPVVVSPPETLDDVLASIEHLGRVVGAREGAARVVAEMRGRIDAVAQAVAGVPEAERVRVFLEIWNDPLMSVGPGAFMHDLIQAAGGVNIFGDADSPWPVVSLEAVVERDPQVVITLFDEAYEQLLAGERAGWEGVSAVRDGRVMLVDENVVSRPGPRLVDGLEQMARFFYPDLLGQEP
ncbi:MAG TPA: cobalamin-binding protein [Bacillota bacterium]